MPLLAMLVGPIPAAIPLVPQLLWWDPRFADGADVVQSTFTIQRQSNVASVANGCITATMPCPIIQQATETTAAQVVEAAFRHMGHLKHAMCV